LFNFHLLSFFTVDSEALLQFILRQLNVPFKIFYSLYYNLTFMTTRIFGLGLDFSG
jgi:hypothetical protein